MFVFSIPFLDGVGVGRRGVNINDKDTFKKNLNGDMSMLWFFAIFFLEIYYGFLVDGQIPYHVHTEMTLDRV